MFHKEFHYAMEKPFVIIWVQGTEFFITDLLDLPDNILSKPNFVGFAALRVK